eukprot:TRINITY_DN2112_c0_g1_i2.p1 TRINITY_DN2112_c0_g1~~TRINITY_DN2112_c0_g1_i2.p1  ORF type:complete len:600 (+),score=238.68 TRINITY_DN2112_c0_g1_i2:47-1846(+)
MTTTGSTKGGWTEYITPEGKRYYFNKSQNINTWDKPLEFKTVEEIAATPTPWQEHVHDTGRKYYYNKTTKASVWDEPSDLKAIREAQETIRQQQREKGIDPDLLEAKEKEKNANDPQVKIATFHELLESKGVTQTWTWEMAMRAVINDDRYKVLNSIAEKKSAFHDFQNIKKQQDKEDKRKREIRNREAFLEMLKTCQGLKPGMTWRKAIGYFEGDVRMDAIKASERESLFEDFMVKLEKETRENAIKTQRENVAKLREIFREDKRIDVNTPWRTVKVNYNDDLLFNALERGDRLLIFQDYIRELEREEEISKRNETIKRRKDARKNRESFRGLLYERYKDGQLNLKTKWHQFVETIKLDERYLRMIDSQQTGSLPSELFGDWLDELEEIFLRERKKVREIINDLAVDFSPKMTQLEFISAIAGHPLFSSLNNKFYVNFYEDYMDELKEEDRKREKDAEKRRRKIENNYFDLLYSHAVKLTTNWDELREKIASHPSFLAVPIEEERLRLFKEFTEGKESESSADEEGNVDDEKKKHKSHRKHKHKRNRSESEEKSRKKQETEANGQQQSVSYLTQPPPQFRQQPSASSVQEEPEEGESK